MVTCWFRYSYYSLLFCYRKILILINVDTVDKFRGIKEMLSNMGAQKVVGFTLMFTVILLSCVTFVYAQYTTEKTTPITIPDSGLFTAAEPEIGVAYKILGAPGATGSVTAAVYNGNPQAVATIPAGVSLTRFTVITFNIGIQNFMQATLIFSYSDADVAGLKAPYAIYKYNPDTNSYVELPSVVDTAAKTITVTLNSVNDPLLAIGGATAASGGIPTSTWVIIVVSSVVIVLVAVFVVSRLRHPATNPEYNFQS